MSDDGLSSFVIHGHFYQPPRENPWTDLVDREESAHPWHDWNDRITAECYRANAFARIFDDKGRVEGILNNYAWISFNFGPTLLRWLERVDPETYDRILEADAQSLRRLGHGNAIAQAYNHLILPLANPRDRRTQVRWGVADFRARFRRDPEALWLPETAANADTLGLLVEEGMRYAILAPGQASRVRAPGGEWIDVSNGSVDPRRPYRWSHPDGSGRSIVLFFYDGPISRSIAFEGVLQSSRRFLDRLSEALGAGKDSGRLVHVATDGESYGHHTRHGERTLGYALAAEAKGRGFRITNYAEFLDRHPPQWEAEIKPGPNGEGTAWSCAHGVGRWARNCGCAQDPGRGWNQEWRRPLRAALDVLRDAAIPFFESEAGRLLRDPWAARDDYVRILLSPTEETREAFLADHASSPLTTNDRVRALRLLEMQHQALLMYTSCGWFFDEISGIESVQVLKYAARALDLWRELGGDPPEARFLEVLGEARSNLPAQGSGADVYRRFAAASRIRPSRAAAHVAMTDVVPDVLRAQRLGLFSVRRRTRREALGRTRLSVSYVGLEDVRTGATYPFAAGLLHLGGLDFYVTVTPFPGPKAYREAQEHLVENFGRLSTPRLLERLVRELPGESFDADDLLDPGRRELLELVFHDTIRGFGETYARLYDENRRILERLAQAGVDLPPELRTAAEFTLSKRFEAEVLRAKGSSDPAAYAPAIAIGREVAERGFRIDRTVARRILEGVAADLSRTLAEEPGDDRARRLLTLFDLARALGVEASFDRTQEVFHEAFLARAGGGVSVDVRVLREIGERLGFSDTLLDRALAREESRRAAAATATTPG